MKVAVLGLGAMGSRIARRLLDHGHEVVVWNRTKAKAEGFPRVADTPADAAHEADVTITMVANPQALREVTRDIEPKTLIEMSTVGPAAIRELAQKIPSLLDAPVLGSRSEVEEGTLHVFVGGPHELYEQYEPLLATLGTVADDLGLSREASFEVLAATPIAAQAERRRAAREANDYPPRFPLSLAHKDADLVTQAAPELRLAEAARSWLADADDASWGERDYSALLAWILEVPDEGEDQRDDKNEQ